MLPLGRRQAEISRSEWANHQLSECKDTELTATAVGLVLLGTTVQPVNPGCRILSRRRMRLLQLCNIQVNALAENFIAIQEILHKLHD